jgi:hypothetical protein
LGRNKKSSYIKDKVSEVEMNSEKKYNRDLCGDVNECKRRYKLNFVVYVQSIIFR